MKNTPPEPPGTKPAPYYENVPEKKNPDGAFSLVPGAFSAGLLLFVAYMVADAKSSSLVTFVSLHEGPYDDVAGWGLLIGWPIMLMYDLVLYAIFIAVIILGMVGLIAGIQGLRFASSSPDGPHARAPFIAGLTLGSVGILVDIYFMVVFFSKVTW